MDIPGISSNKTPPAQIFDNQRRLAKTDSVHKVSQPSLATRQAAARHTPSSDLVRLTAKLEGIPDIRPELIAKASQRLASGYYLTRESAEATAEALDR